MAQQKPNTIHQSEYRKYSSHRFVLLKTRRYQKNTAFMDRLKQTVVPQRVWVYIENPEETPVKHI